MNLLFGFSGRIGRLQWWLAQVAILVICVACTAIMIAAVGVERLGAGPEAAATGSGLGLVLAVLAMAALTTWIGLAASVKRFHDRDKSGFWCLIVLIPMIGAVWQLVECGFLPGMPGNNRFGRRDSVAPAAGLADMIDVGTSIAAANPIVATSQRSSLPQTSRLKPRGKAGFGRRGR